MTEEQAKALKVGDKVRCVDNFGVGYLTSGKEYKVAGIDSDGDPYIVDDADDFAYIYGEYLGFYAVIETHVSPYRIELASTCENFDDSGMVRVVAYVNDDLLGLLRDIEAEQGREAKRKAIREQIEKLEAELADL